MLNEAKRLHSMGFAIHWLRPKSKVPLTGGWTKGPRKSWAELEAQYRAGFNLGVRLGAASRFPDGTYLAVIDCDVKSNSPEHLATMEEALGKLGDFENAPVVRSGRGNGSRHIYIRTKEPLNGFEYSQSPVKVRAKMPSVKPSKLELETMQKKDVDAGYRMRAAWEISVMGEGRQVVLPPSIHPDSGAEYEWLAPLRHWQSIPELGITAPNSVKRNRGKLSAFKFQVTETDLVSSGISDSLYDLIVKGENCSDRSAALFTACIGMTKAGFSDDEILTVLTDRENYLGQAAYDHAQTDDRMRAAQWVKVYTLDKVRNELSAAVVFAEEAVIEEMSEEATKRQAAWVKAETNWSMNISREGGKVDGRPKCTLKNVILILTNVVPGGGPIFKRNEFANVDHYSSDTPWGGRDGQELNDIDLVLIKVYLADHWRFEPASTMILEAIQKLAWANKYHPIRDYLDGLEWDGVSRLEGWLTSYLGAVGPREYIRAVGTKTLTAMVARVMRPGCKYDTVLVLEGPQGCGKSSAVKMLADPWSSDAMIDIASKDAVLAMRLAWVMELGELSSMRKADIDQLKQFITQPVDRIRVPYGRLPETFPRQSIFIGTTNSSEYLKDTTGNRRFWPVTVSQCDFARLKKDRDQLLAEAKVFWEMGETLYLNSEIEKVAQEEQSQRVFVDELVGQIEGFLNNPREGFPVENFAISDLFGDFGLPELRATPGHTPAQMRVASALRLLGYAKIRKRGNGSRRVTWGKIPELAIPGPTLAIPKPAR